MLWRRAQPLATTLLPHIPWVLIFRGHLLPCIVCPRASPGRCFTQMRIIFRAYRPLATALRPWRRAICGFDAVVDIKQREEVDRDAEDGRRTRLEQEPCASTAAKIAVHRLRSELPEDNGHRMTHATPFSRSMRRMPHGEILKLERVEFAVLTVRVDERRARGGEFTAAYTSKIDSDRRY